MQLPGSKKLVPVSQLPGQIEFEPIVVQSPAVVQYDSALAAFLELPESPRQTAATSRQSRRCALSQEESQDVCASYHDLVEHADEVKDGITRLVSKGVRTTTNDRYDTTGLWQKIARHHVFEHVTLGVIALNAIWMAVDTDWNKAETLPEAGAIFQVMEHAFCTYFSVELFIRFRAFHRKVECCYDSWFVFDSLLVILMVSETWLLLIISSLMNVEAKFPLGNTALLRLVRLLRLSRLLKMLKSMPELQVLVKAMVTAMKSVLYVMCIFLGVLYVFGILCTQLSVDTAMGQMFFGNVLHSMYSLMVYATFLDEVSHFMDNIRAESIPVLIVVFLFIAIGCCTLLNMLLGVLCEVISEVSAEEVEKMQRALVAEQIWRVALILDNNSNGRVSATEFQDIFQNAEALQSLENVGIDPLDVVDCAAILFENENGQEVDLPFDAFMEAVFELRSTNEAKLKDVKFVWKRIMPQLDHMLEKVAIIKERLQLIEEQSVTALGQLLKIAETMR